MKTLQIEDRDAGLLVQRHRSGDVQYVTAAVVAYEGNDADKVRGVSRSSYDGLMLRTYENAREGGIYGDATLAYYDRFSVERHELEGMLALLRKVEKRQAAMVDTEGTARTFGQQVNRLARALGVKRVTIYDKELVPRNGTGYVHYTQLGDAVWAVDHTIERWFPRKAEVAS